ncbi:MAG: D-glycero-alpha-D-manno-heptose-1,7-bisphosphate 7-phosphatase [Candidatus Loosdrechtia sp.]|uniref:D-glycero-alpha-D-manno-heptose-1,7-bisphosphate 7-phosphatase n=1 Tax=Candidatus Loosdrechtia sp. TaxID=3101272 RepID=UPI003A6BB1DF|nr:MAG: HAD family hydrolase [Candidatus Jettenia sp. AMX2]
MKRKAVFLDRDGTVIVHEPYLSSPDQLKLLPNAVEGIQLFKQHGYLAIIVTNQSGIARGFFDEERLILLHNKLLNMLAREGIVVDDIFYCPHYSEGVIDRYTIDCDCRKPKPKMLFDAARRHCIDLSQSVMIGDSDTDMLAGKNAGCCCVLIGDAETSHCHFMHTVDYVVHDLLEAAKLFT